MFDTIKRKRQELRAQLYILHRGLGDPRVGLHVKLLATLIIAYIISPVDLIPDFIPVLGLLDELVLVPAGIFLILKLIPEHLRQEYMDNQVIESVTTDRLKILGTMLVVCIWSGLFLIFYRLWVD